MEPTYHPIACGFHDRLEDWAVRRVPVEVVWREGEQEKRVTAHIADVYAQDRADWLRLDTEDDPIRLDRLISVDGIPLPDAC